MLTRDELAKTLETNFSAIISETGDWRPLAQYVLDLLAHIERWETWWKLESSGLMEQSQAVPDIRW